MSHQGIFFSGEGLTQILAELRIRYLLKPYLYSESSSIPVIKHVAVDIIGEIWLLYET